ncbi:MAG: N-succinyldiaminopimelate aminotransferase [Planctomycetota bacterium]|jgi:N-succinyldiaminopimelate aminotransferase
MPSVRKTMNNELSRLHPYPFEKLAALKNGLIPPENLPHIALSMGEPQHPAPGFVIDSLIAHMHQLSNYPSTRGSIELRESIAAWLTRRFALNSGLIDVEKHILPVNGTREALFAIAQCVIDRNRKGATMFMPNPFYQIYEGAAILAGAEPVYLNCLEENNYLPDLDQISDAQWQACQMIYLCNPGNPTGAVMPIAYQQRLIELAQRHDFVIVSDECYSEIFFDEKQPPPGLLEVAAGMGIDDFNRCLVFHSLSKRSNLPGLRSGFVAGDAQVIRNFLLYRTYHGCAMPPATQTASAVAWADEDHVIENRRLYRVKFEQVLSLLSDTLAPQKPQAGFYLWAKTPVADTEFARRLYAEQNVTVLPGQYLSRNNADGNPGENRVRMALVASLEECVEAAHRINSLLSTL